MPLSFFSTGGGGESSVENGATPRAPSRRRSEVTGVPAHWTLVTSCLVRLVAKLWAGGREGADKPIARRKKRSHVEAVYFPPQISLFCFQLLFSYSVFKVCFYLFFTLAFDCEWFSFISSHFQSTLCRQRAHHSTSHDARMSFRSGSAPCQESGVFK